MEKKSVGWTASERMRPSARGKCRSKQGKSVLLINRAQGIGNTFKGQAVNRSVKLNAHHQAWSRKKGKVKGAKTIIRKQAVKA